MTTPIHRIARQLIGSGLRAQLLRGGAGSLLIKAGHAALAFTVAVVLARVLGPDGYGVYSFALAIIMLTAIPAQVGVPQLVVRETAKAQSNKDWGLMRGLWRWSNIAVAMFSVLSLLVVGGVLLFLDSAEGGRAATLAAGIALIPLIALANVRSACLRGLRMVVWGQLPESIFRPALLLILVGSCMVLLDTETLFSPIDVMGLHVFAAAVTFVLGWLMLWKVRPEGVKSRPQPSYEYSLWRKAVIPLGMITGLQFINNYADLIILGIVRSDEEVGIYRAVSQLAMLVIFGLQAINQVLHPHFAAFHASGAHAKLQRLVTLSSRIILGLATIPLALFTFAGKPVLGMLFGPEYAVGVAALIILAFGQFANAGFGSVGALLNMTGHERDTMRGMIVAITINVLLNVALIPSFGIEGAAVATATSFVVWNAILRICVRRRLAIESSAIGHKYT